VELEIALAVLAAKGIAEPSMKQVPRTRTGAFKHHCGTMRAGRGAGPGRQADAVVDQRMTYFRNRFLGNPD
jgi:hypothetical protein